MEQNEWFSPPPKSDSTPYYDLNDINDDKLHDQDLMTHIESNIYDNHQSFSLEYNFDIPELDPNLAYDNNHPSVKGPPNGLHGLHGLHSHNSSTAFPPTDIMENTPLIVPHKTHLTTAVVSSPILPSQNDKSFNNQHYYHKLQRNKSKELFEANPSHQHIRPDAVFTPLVSPSQTPADKKHTHPIQTSFEPLTSPALPAQDSNAAYNKRKPSSTFAASDDKPSIYKRRTPHGTPILVSNKKSPGSAANFEKLPESSMAAAKSESTSASTTPMLPPQRKSDHVTSPQLMSFTMGKLASHGARESNQEKPTSLEISPILKSRTSSMSKSSDNSPTLSATRTREKPATKKASHKLAEQGRRQRMNVAIHSLGSLIPQNYHDQVTIPSKATTVELAAKYIQDLLDEIDQLKQS